MEDVPKPIVDAVNALLAPYGRSYDPMALEAAPPPKAIPVKGYMRAAAAAKYIGVSRMTLWRWEREGLLQAAFKLPTRNKKGVVLFAVEELDAFIARNRPEGRHGR